MTTQYRSSAGYNGDVLAPLQVFPTQFTVWNTEMEKLLGAVNQYQQTINPAATLYVGCGRRIPFKEAWNVDLDPNMGEGMEHFKCADMRELPFDDEAFSLVLSSHTLEHVSYEDCRKALKEQCRVVKVGGIVGAIVPDIRWTKGLDSTHLREYTQEEFVSLFRFINGFGQMTMVTHGEAQPEYSFYVVWRRAS